MVSKDKTVKLVRAAAAFFFLTACAQAHVGSPDVYFEGNAGPYKLLVTVRSPLTIPGVAEIEVRVETPGIRELRAVPLAIAGAGAKFAPVPDLLKVSARDAQFFTGSLWMMTSGSWQVRLTADGSQGKGALSVPLPSFARSSKRMQLGLGVLLSVLGLFLVCGLAAIIGASGEAELDANQQLTAKDRRRRLRATLVGGLLLLVIVWASNVWWNSEARDYNERIYKPLQMSASRNGTQLSLEISETGWMQAKSKELAAYRLFTRNIDDLVADHGHIMHLYVIRQPGLDVIYHLHPEQRASGSFNLTLPSMAAGHYKLYADIVHSNGFPETMVSEIDLPALTSRPLSGDDASATTEPWQQAALSKVFTLPDGYKMEWLHDAQPLRANEPISFNFRLTKADGSSAPSDMALYMGMLGHAAFVKTDGKVFAHIHPNGTVSMAALMLASGMPAGMDHSAMHMDETMPNTVSFPYGFPTPGRYRIFVQMKHGETVETGAFDAIVGTS